MTRIYILVMALFIGIMFTLQPFPVTAAPTIWTVGSSGDFSSVSQALSSGLVRDGDVLRFVSDVYDFSDLVIDINITVDGAWHSWHLSSISRGSSIGLYVVDRPTSRISFSLANVTILVDTQGINSVLWTNATDIDVSNVSFISTPNTYNYGYAIFGYYNSQVSNVSIRNVFINASIDSAIYLSYQGDSDTTIFVDGLYCLFSEKLLTQATPSGLSIDSNQNSRVILYANNLFFDNLYYGIKAAIYNYDTTDVNIIELSNIGIGRVQMAGIQGAYYWRTNYKLRYENISVMYSDGYAIYLTTDGVQYADLDIKNVFVNYSRDCSIYVKCPSTINGDIRVDNVSILNSYRQGIYIDTRYETFISKIDLSNIYIGYAYYEALTIYSLGEDTNVNVDSLYINEAGEAGYPSIYFKWHGHNDWSRFHNLYIGRSHYSGIQAYIMAESSSLDLNNVYIGDAGRNAIHIWSTYVVPMYNNITLSNTWVKSIADGYYTLYIWDRSDAFRDVVVRNSALNGSISLTNLDSVRLIETFFNESGSALKSTHASITWTLDIYTISKSSKQPISGASITIYNGSNVLAAGYTGPDGHFRYTLNYIIDDVTRTAPYLSTIASLDTSMAVWNNSAGTTLPSWFTDVTLELEYYALSTNGFTNMGYAKLVIYGNTGYLKIYIYLDVLNPSNNRVMTHPLTVVSQYSYGGISVYEVLIGIDVLGRTVWYPAKIIVDLNTGQVIMIGPIIFSARI